MWFEGRNCFLIVAAGALGIVALDQISKALVVRRIAENTGFEAIPGLLNLVHTRNPGAAFGMLADLPDPARAMFFLCVSLAAVGLIIWMTATAAGHSRFMLSGYTLFLGGALGNLTDRLRYDRVIDFLDFHVGVYHWPAFNVADSALTLAVACFFLGYPSVVRNSRADRQ